MPTCPLVPSPHAPYWWLVWEEVSQKGQSQYCGIQPTDWRSSLFQDEWWRPLPASLVGCWAQLWSLRDRPRHWQLPMCARV